MIKFILLVNKLGQTRLAQYFTDISKDERKTLESELVRKCLGRDDSKCSIIIHRNYKIVYRRYVSLYFIVAIDLDEEVGSVTIYNSMFLVFYFFYRMDYI